MRYQRLITIVTIFLFLSACQSSGSHEPDDSSQTQHNPAAAAFNVQLGLSYLNEKLMERSKHKLLKALEQDPNSATTNGAMAYYLEVTANIPQADAYYRKAISFAEDKGPALNNYGGFLCRQKQYQNAEQYFLRAVAVPTYVRSSEAYENAGLCELKLPNIAKAKQYFQRALEQDPKRSSSLYELARLALEENQLTLAKQYLNQYSQSGELDLTGAELGLKIARRVGESDQAATYVMMIQKFKQQAKATADQQDPTANNNTTRAGEI